MTTRFFNAALFAALCAAVYASQPKLGVGYSAVGIHGDMLVFGGCNRSYEFNQVWEFTPRREAWSLMNSGAKAAAPSGRDGHTCVVNRGRMVIFSGWHGLDMGHTLNDTWTFDPVRDSWTLVQPADGVVPHQRAASVAVLDDFEQLMYIFGGSVAFQGPYLNDLWVLDLDQHLWRQIKPRSKSAVWPSERWGHRAARLGHGMVFYGGMNGKGEVLDEIYEFNFHTQSFELIEQKNKGPGARVSSSLVPLGDDAFLVFGGSDGKTLYNDLWVFFLRARRWERVHAFGDAPQPRWIQTASVIDGRMLAFGGQDAQNNFINDLWSFDLLSHRWTELEKPDLAIA